MNSPTGRNPRMLWSPALQDAWQRMITENHPWWQTIQANASRLENGISVRYNSAGRWETLAYLFSGDLAYGRAAVSQLTALWTFMEGYFADPGNPLKWADPSNNLKEWIIEWIRQYDALGPAMTPEEDARFLALLKRSCDWIVGSAGGPLLKQPDGSFNRGAIGGVRYGDSDLYSCTHLGLALMDAVFGTHYLDGWQVDLDNVASQPVKPLGGLTPSAADHTTARNHFRFFVERLAKGGQWFESTDYNEDTVPIVLMGWRCLRDVLGADYYPELGAFLRDQARFLMHLFTPDLRQSHQWGDEESANIIAWHLVHWLLGTLSSYQDDPALNAMMTQFLTELDAANGVVFGPLTFPLYAPTFYTMTPYTPSQEWRGLAGLELLTEGTGHAYARTGHAPTDRSMTLYCQRWQGFGVDHQMPIHGDVLCYENGERVLWHPLCYMPDLRFHNMMLVCGSNSMEAGAIVAQGVIDGVVAYQAGSNGGCPSMFAFTIPTFIHENTRSTFYFLRGGRTTLLVLDRVHADDPRALYPTDADLLAALTYQVNVDTIKHMGVLKHGCWHTPVAPALDTDSITWPIQSGTARIRTLTPAVQMTVVDEHLDTTLGGYILDDQKHFRVDVAPTVLQPFDIFATVFSTADGPHPEAVVLAAASGDPVTAVDVVIDGQHLIAVISAKIGPKLISVDDGTGHNKQDAEGRLALMRGGRLLTQGFALELAHAATVLVADLDPSRLWEVNGRPLAQAGDLFYADLPAGTMTVQAVGAAPVPVPVPVPTPTPTPVPVPVPASLPPAIPPSKDHIRLTVRTFDAHVSAGAEMFVDFELTVPDGHDAVFIEAKLGLVNHDGMTSAQIIGSGLDEVTGIKIQAPSVPGTYLLTLNCRDDQGGVDATARRREVVVT